MNKTKLTIAALIGALIIGVSSSGSENKTTGVNGLHTQTTTAPASTIQEISTPTPLPTSTPIPQPTSTPTPFPIATPTPTQSVVYNPQEANSATAQCRDGSLSYSAHRQGTCSHHGGVAVWY